MKKRLIALLIAASALFAALSGCSGGKKPDTSEPLSQNDTSSETESSESDQPDMNKTINLSENSSYSFSYTKALRANGLTKADLSDEASSIPVKCTAVDVPHTFGDWCGNTHTTSLFAEKSPCFYIKNDLGFPALLEECTLRFDPAFALPEKALFFYSDDGYNFNFYAGELSPDSNGTCHFVFPSPVTAKAVKCYIFSGKGSENSVGLLSFVCRGIRTDKRILLSEGIAYKTDGVRPETHSAFNDPDFAKLTNGVTGAYTIDRENYVALEPTVTDELTGFDVINFDFDLGCEKNVSELYFSVMKLAGTDTESFPIRFASVKYSSDGNSYHDFSMGFADGEISPTGTVSGNSRVIYPIMRNHTVKARYIKLCIFTSSALLIDEVSIYGAEKPVSQPDYTFFERTDKTDSDILTGAKITLDNTVSASLTDGVLHRESDCVMSAGGSSVKLTLPCDKPTDLTGVALILPAQYAKNIQSISVFGDQAAKIDISSSITEVGSFSYINLFLTASASELTVEFTVTDSTLPFGLSQVKLYSGDPCYPLIRGGFYGFFVDYIEGYNPHHYYDSYRLYLQLKGFRELGMDTLLIGSETLSFLKKKTLIGPPEGLTGYTKGKGHGVYDLNEAVLSAADSLGMRIYLSTAIGYTYPEIAALGAVKAEEYISEYTRDAGIMISHMWKKYKSHSSFYGFYLTDETCDAWLSSEKHGNTDYTRRIYKSQSDLIRSLDSNLKIAIAPATWRADTPENYGKNLYNLIKPDSDSGLPLVDVVMSQDCLGREASITVDSAVYEAYYKYLFYQKHYAEKAGAVYQNDTEIFDIGYRIKRYDEIIRSLALESFAVNSSLVYDLSHYFSSQGRGNFFRYAYFDNDWNAAMYAIYFNSMTVGSLPS